MHLRVWLIKRTGPEDDYFIRHSVIKHRHFYYGLNPSKLLFDYSLAPTVSISDADFISYGAGRIQSCNKFDAFILCRGQEYNRFTGGV
jgi:hypothetical protein